MSRVEAGARLSLSLASALEDEQTTTRLVALCPSGPGETFDPAFASAVRACQERLCDVLPFDRSHPLETFMVVAPGRIGQYVPRALFLPECLANVYVAPEDRTHPSDTNLLVNGQDLFDAHVAHAIVNLTDLWSDLREDDPRHPHHSVLGAIAEREPTTDLYIQVVRCFSRLIDGGYLIDHLASRSLHLGSSWPNPDPRSFQQIEIPPSVVEHFVDQYFAKHQEALGPSTFFPLQEEGQRAKPPGQGFGRLVRRLAADLRRDPSELLDKEVARLYQRAGRRVEEMASPDGSFALLRWASAPAGASRVEPSQQVPPSLPVPDGAVGPAWADLRDIALGLVDGTPLPAGIDEQPLQRTNLRGVVANPDEIVPDPRQPPLAQPRGTGGERPTSATRACDPLRSDPQLAVPAPHEVGKDEEEPVAGRSGSPEPNSLVWAIGRRLGQHLRGVEREATATVEGIAPSVDSGSHLPQQAGLAPEAYIGEVGGQSGHRRAARRTFALYAAIVTVLAVAAGSLLLQRLRGPQVLVAGSVLVVVWAILLLASAYLAVRRLERERSIIVRQRLGELNQALFVAQRRGDVQRLRQRYEEYLDWAEILGWFTHRPWVGTPLEHAELPDPVDGDTLPAAFGVASGLVSDEHLERLCARAVNLFFQPSWLVQLFEEVQATAVRSLVDQGLDENLTGPWPPDPAADTSQGPQSSRRHLLGAVRRGSYQSLEEISLGKRLLAFVDDLPVDRAFDQVVPLPNPARRQRAGGAELGRAAPGPLPPTAAWLEPPTGLNQLVELVAPAVVRVSGAGDEEGREASGVIVQSDGLVVTDARAVAHADEVKVRLWDGGVLSGTVVGRSDRTDLVLVRLSGQEVLLPAAPLAPPSSLRPGQAVVSLSDPCAQVGDVSLNWGLVTEVARARRLSRVENRFGSVDVVNTSYPNGTGDPGAPVFDLSGNLVGVHSGTPDPGRHHSSAVRGGVAAPASEVRRLLDALSGRATSSSRGTRAVAVSAVTATASRLTETLPPGEFLRVVLASPVESAFLPDHWTSGPDAAKVDEVERQPPDDRGPWRIQQLCQGGCYQHPLRLLVRRVDLAPIARADTLSSCAGRADITR